MWLSVRKLPAVAYEQATMTAVDKSPRGGGGMRSTEKEQGFSDISAH